MRVTKEMIDACKSQAELDELMIGGKMRNAPLRQEGLDLSTEDRRIEMRKAPATKMYGQAPVKRKKHELGLGYLDEEQNLENVVKGVVSDRVERVKQARTQQEVNDTLAGLNPKPEVSDEEMEAARKGLEDAMNRLANS